MMMMTEEIVFQKMMIKINKVSNKAEEKIQQKTFTISNFVNHMHKCNNNSTLSKNPNTSSQINLNLTSQMSSSP